VRAAEGTEPLVLSGRTVLVGACGGIALYKVPLLISRLRELGASVHVVMTQAATRLVSPLTFQTVSGNPVHTDLFAPPQLWNVEHIALAERADLCVVAPATANILGKAASGIADDFLSTVLLAVACPVLFVPAMNSRMYTHPAVQRNIATLRGFGHEVLDPDIGPLACGTSGPGRYPETERVLAACLRLLGPGDLVGRRVVVSAGPTREFLDPVRFISNPSTGRMGFALAAEARRRGAEVILVSGPTDLPPPPEVETVRVTSTAEMRSAVLGAAETADAVIMAAAPADWAPAAVAPEKIRKRAEGLKLDLRLTPDILAELGARRGAVRRPVLVGFAVETCSLLEKAREKLIAKNLDFIVANPVAPDSGFAAETNRATILPREGAPEELPLQSKSALARAVLDRVVLLLREGSVHRGADSDAAPV